MGDNLIFEDVEKNTNNLYALGDSYTADINDEPCCFVSYFTKFDTALAIQYSKELNFNFGHNGRYAAAAKEIYYAGNPSGFLIGGMGFDPYHHSLTKLDTAGNILWQKYYYCPNQSSYIANIMQADSDYYLLESVSVNGNGKPGIRKIDFNGNTIFFNVLDTTSGYVNVYVPIMIAREDSIHLLISALFSPSPNGIGRYRPLMIETDLSGNVTQAVEGIDSNYVGASIDTLTKAFLFVRHESSSIPIQLEKEYINIPSCNYTSIAFSPMNSIAQDSTFIPTTIALNHTLSNIFNSTSAFTLTSTNICLFNGINNLYDGASSSFSLFPNPATNTFTIKNLSSKEKTLVEIINVMGEKVFSETYNSQLPTVNCQLFSKGIYFVRVSDGEKNVVRKLVVE